MTDLFLAGPVTIEHVFLAGWPHTEKPLNLLVSHAYKRQVCDATLPPTARLMLDSGAYTAWSTGQVIDMNGLILAGMDPRYTDVVALDVIGDADASVRNALKMKAAGSRAFPVFHYGDPWEHLALYCREFKQVGLSCRFGEPVKKSLAWLEQSFARGWPCRFHSFGWTSYQVLGRFPFDSADSTTWFYAYRYGSCGFMGPRTNVKRKEAIGPAQGDAAARWAMPPGREKMGLIPEIQYVWNTQALLRVQWSKQLQEARSR